MRLYRRLLRYLKPYLGQFVAALFFMVVYSAATAGVPFFVKDIIDEIFISKNRQQLWFWPALIVGLFFIKGGAQFIQSYNMKKIGQAVVRDLRSELFAHMQKLSLSFFHRHPTGGLISRYINDILLVQESVTLALASLIRDSMTILCLIVVIFYRDWHMSLIGVVVLPVALFPILRFGKTSRRVGKKSQVQIGELSTIVHENVTGAKVVRAFTMEEAESTRFDQENQRLYKLYLKMKKVEALSPAVMEFLGSFGVAGVILYGGYQVIYRDMTTGTLVSFLMALMFLYEPIKRLASVNNKIQEALAASDRIFSILDTEPEIQDGEGARTLAGVERQVEFRDVSFSYGRESVLEGVNLKVETGEKVAIVGSSGGGKSTLVNLIPRFYDPQSGGVLIDGHDIREYTLASLRRNIAVVTQETILFNDTIAANRLYGRPGAGREELIEASRAAHADDFIAALPQGYETNVGERGLMLSGGERQRICIARAFLKNAPVLILDEATSALDSEAAKIVQEALANLLEGKTAFIIAHSFATVLQADRIVVIDGGCIADGGTHDELMGRSGLYRRLYELQFKERYLQEQ